MRFNQNVVVSNVLIVLSDAARQDKFGGFKVNPDSIKQVLIPIDGSESTTKGKLYKDIVQWLHVLFRRWTVYNCIPYLFNSTTYSVTDTLPSFCFYRCCFI